jgi:N-acetylglucosamine kinase-like BadF-type ATPase
MELGHDSLIALYSVMFGKPGVVVIGGTGSVGFGRDAQGRTARTGGWEYTFGDEGSGYWIGVRALSACARAGDGTGPKTSLLAYILRALRVSTFTDVHRPVYSGAISRPDIAALAKGVHEAAVARNRVAQTILRQAGKELGQLAAGVIRALKLQEDRLTVGMAGGVFKAGAWVADPFKRVVLEEAPYARARRPEIPPAAAAALLALEHIGGVVDEPIIDNLKATLSAAILGRHSNIW